MGGDTNTQSPLQGGAGDEGGTPKEVAGDGVKVRRGRDRGDDNSEGRDEGEQRDYGRSVRDGTYGGGKLDNGHGPSPVGVPGRETDGGGHMAGGGTDPQEEDGLTGHWPRGGDVEGSGGDFKSPAHGLHHLPRLPPWFTGGSWYRYRYPRGQAASEASGLEGGGPVRDLPESAQGV